MGSVQTDAERKSGACRVSEIMPTLYELEAALTPHLADNAELEGALHRHASALMDLLEVPLHIEVGVEHWRSAVALATAFVDGDLFISELSAEARLSAADPGRRAAVVYALVQLIVDVLAVSVNPDGDMEPDEAKGSALQLLSKLALVRGVA
jgi:hypothetical protein